MSVPNCWIVITSLSDDPLGGRRTIAACEVAELYRGDETQIFYIWGHSFEFEEKGTWDAFEAFLKTAGGREDVCYLTNREAFGI